MSAKLLKSECSNSETLNNNNTDHWNKQVASHITESLSEFYCIFLGELDRFITEVVQFVPAENPKLIAEALFVHRSCIEEKKETFIKPIEGMLEITMNNLATSMIELTKKEIEYMQENNGELPVLKQSNLEGPAGEKTDPIDSSLTATFFRNILSDWNSGGVSKSSLSKEMPLMEEVSSTNKEDSSSSQNVIKLTYSPNDNADESEEESKYNFDHLLHWKRKLANLKGQLTDRVTDSAFDLLAKQFDALSTDKDSVES